MTLDAKFKNTLQRAPTFARDTTRAPAETLDLFRRMMRFEKRVAVELIHALQEKLGLSEKEFAVGVTKVFAKEHTHGILETARKTVHGQIVQRIQAWVRGRKAWRRSVVAKNLSALVKSIDGHSKPLLSGFANVDDAEVANRELVGLIELARNVSVRSDILSTAETTQQSLAVELEAACEVRNLLRCKSRDPVLLDKALARFHDLSLQSKDVSLLEERSCKLKVQLPLMRAMQSLKDADEVDGVQLRALIDEIHKEGLHNGGWLDELDGRALFRAVMAKADREDPKMFRGTSIRSSRATITGLRHVEQLGILRQLDQAAEEFNVEKLEELLGTAVEHGASCFQSLDTGVF